MAFYSLWIFCVMWIFGQGEPLWCAEQYEVYSPEVASCVSGGSQYPAYIPPYFPLSAYTLPCEGPYSYMQSVSHVLPPDGLWNCCPVGSCAQGSGAAEQCETLVTEDVCVPVQGPCNSVCSNAFVPVAAQNNSCEALPPCDFVPLSPVQPDGGCVEEDDLNTQFQVPVYDKKYLDSIGCVVWAGSKNRRPLTLRTRRLLEALKSGRKCFKDLHHLYGKNQQSTFRLDLLEAMHHYADIDEINGGYYCKGTLSHVSTPEEPVAMAMFNLFCRRKCSIFEMKFQLYNQGYRDYTSEFLDNVEMALIVGDVHPLGRTIHAQYDVDLDQKMKNVWREVQNYDHVHLNAYLLKPPPHINGFLDTRYKRVMRRLWEMQFLRYLDIFKVLKARMKMPASEDLDSKGQIVEDSRKINRKALVMAVLRKNEGTPCHIADIAQQSNLQEVYVPRKKEFLGVVLSLVWDQWSFIYNKDDATVMLLKEKAPKVIPAKNTNFLTMMYDLTRKYGAKLTKEEVGYYVHFSGHAHEYLPKAGKKKKGFYENIERDIEFLAIQEHIPLGCCPKPRRDTVKHHRALWRRFKDTPSDVSCGCADDDRVIVQIREFRKSARYLVFLDYIKNPSEQRASCAGRFEPHTLFENNMRLVQNRVRTSPVSRSDLFDFCDEHLGMKVYQKVWEVFGALTTRTEGGRLIYNPHTEIFSWDDDGCVPTPEEGRLIETIFSLRYMPRCEISYMLQQNGFQGVGERFVRKVLYGFEVLCLMYMQDNAFKQERTLLEAALKAKTYFVPESFGVTCASWAWQTVQMLLSWTKDGTLENLWKTYLATTEHGAACGDAGGDMSCAKRPRLCDPEEIISSEMPSLYQILQEIKARNAAGAQYCGAAAYQGYSSEAGRLR